MPALTMRELNSANRVIYSMGVSKAVPGAACERRCGLKKIVVEKFLVNKMVVGFDLKPTL